MSKWSLNFKMAAVVAVLVLGSITIAYLGLSRMNSINESLNDIVNKNADRLIYALEIKSLFYLQMVNERNFILEDSKEGMAEARKLFEKRNDELKKYAENLEKISTSQGREHIAQFLEFYEQWFKNSEEVQVLATNGDDKKAFTLSQTVGKGFRTQAEKIITEISDTNQKEMDEEVQETERVYIQSRNTMMSVSGGSILFSVTLATLVLFTLGRTIGRVISDLNTNTEHVNGAAQQIATASEELSQAATEQASSLEETVATIEELTSMVQVNTQNAQAAAQLSNETSNMAVKGEKEIRELVHSMSDISSDSKKISEIINVIEDIAFQTNLLALNAAVEAARAGEQGKGFAVVADAVRSLAQRSASAAKDIADLIKRSVAKIETGSHQADQSGVALSDIVNSIKKVAQLNGEIATASAEQTNGIVQISKAMNQLDQVTQINAASSEEAAATAEELSAQSAALSDVVEVLILTVKGGKGDGSGEIFSHMAVKSERKKSVSSAFVKRDPPPPEKRETETVLERGAA